MPPGAIRRRRPGLGLRPRRSSASLQCPGVGAPATPWSALAGPEGRPVARDRCHSPPRAARSTLRGMCRSIRQLRRADEAGPATTGEAQAAALQYVRKISGFREPSARNAEAFAAAVDEIATITERLLLGRWGRRWPRARTRSRTRSPAGRSRAAARPAAPRASRGPRAPARARDHRAPSRSRDAQPRDRAAARPRPHLVAPPGLRRRRRPPVAQRRGPRGAGPRARDAALRLRPRPARARTCARCRRRSPAPASRT